MHMFTQAFEGENGEITEKSLREEVIPQNIPTTKKHQSSVPLPEAEQDES